SVSSFLFLLYLAAPSCTLSPYTSLFRSTAPGDFTVTATDIDDPEISGSESVSVLEPGQVYEPSVTVAPGEAEPGDEVTVGGEGFVPESPVTIVVTDADGNEVGTIEDVTTDEDGGFSE